MSTTTPPLLPKTVRTWNRLTWPALAILSLIILFGYIRARSNSQARIKTVNDALATARFDEARRLIDQWGQENPRDGEPDYYRARLEVALDHPVEAMDALRKTIEHGYSEEPVLILRAVLQARAGMFDLSEPILRSASENGAEPKAEIAEGLARIYLGTFRLPEAGQAIDRWMQAAPNDARPYMWRNDIDERMAADPAILVRNYRAALQRDPNLESARLGLAQLLLGMKSIDEAEVEFASYIERNPRSLEGQLGAGQVALIKGELNAAETCFKNALEIDPKDPVALSELGLIDLRNNRFLLARDRLKQAVEALPLDPEVRYKYSRALKMSGDDVRAAEESATSDRLKAESDKINDLRKALVQNPKDADLRSEAARWLIEHGHDKEGLEWTELILRQQPGHVETCKLLADYHSKKGNAGLANYYRMAASNTP